MSCCNKQLRRLASLNAGASGNLYKPESQCAKEVDTNLSKMLQERQRQDTLYFSKPECTQELPLTNTKKTVFTPTISHSWERQG
jgi:hypothetical protein